MNMHCIIWLNKVIYIWSMLKVMNADWVLITVMFSPTHQVKISRLFSSGGDLRISMTTVWQG